MTTTDRALDTLAGWTRLWNGELTLAPSLVTDDFTIRFGGVGAAQRGGDTLRGPEAFAAFIAAFRAPRPSLVYSHVLTLAGDGHAVSIWNARADDLDKGGIDVFEVAPDGRFSRAWSVTAERPMS